MRPLATLLVLAAALLAAGPAAAKGVVDVEVCGASECATIHAGEARAEGSALAYGLLDVGTSVRFARTPPAQPWYSVTVEADWFGDPRTMTYADGLLGVDNHWIDPNSPVATWLKRLTRDLAPKPTVTVVQATVNGRAASDPAAYGALLGDLPLADPPDRLGRSTVIRLTPDAATSWADPDRPLGYFAPQRLLKRGPEWLRVPDDLAAAIAADAGLAPAPTTAPTSRAGFPAGDVAAVLSVLAAVAVALLAVSRRRRRSPAT
jgi:hypothetical protein